MKKRLVAVVLMLTILLTPMAGYDLVYAKENEDPDETTKEVEKIIEEIIEDLEDLVEELEEQKDIADEQGITDDDLERAIQEVEQSEDLEAQPVADIQMQGQVSNEVAASYRRSIRPIGIIKRQIQLKYQFVANAKETYRLTSGINENLNLIRKEIRAIAKTPDRKFTDEQLGQIKAINRELKEEVGTVDYTTGQLTREMRRYIGFVRGKRFKSAIGAFENMVYIQQRQLEILELILDNTDQLLECLYAV